VFGRSQGSINPGRNERNTVAAGLGGSSRISKDSNSALRSSIVSIGVQSFDSCMEHSGGEHVSKAKTQLTIYGYRFVIVFQIQIWECGVLSCSVMRCKMKHVSKAKIQLRIYRSRFVMCGSFWIILQIQIWECDVLSCSGTRFGWGGGSGSYRAAAPGSCWEPEG
jgi:hypothetical protein